MTVRRRAPALARLLALAAAPLAACAPRAAPAPAWVPTQPWYVAPRSGFELVPPPAWMRLHRGDDGLVLTRDGTPLQRIVVAASEVGKPLGLGASKRAVRAGMSPLELAELVIDDLRATESLTEIRVLENAPATVAGLPGFRLGVAFHDERGLARRLVLYGVLYGAHVYRLFYLAPERVYFARDLPVFEELVRTFRIRATAPAAPSGAAGWREGGAAGEPASLARAPGTR